MLQDVQLLAAQIVLFSFLATVVHLLPIGLLARLFGVRVLQLRLFMWPVFARFPLGDLSVELGVLPLGGHIRFQQGEDSPASYILLAPAKQAVMAASGVVALLVVGLLLGASIMKSAAKGFQARLGKESFRNAPSFKQAAALQIGDRDALHS